MIQLTEMPLKAVGRSAFASLSVICYVVAQGLLKTKHANHGHSIPEEQRKHHCPEDRSSQQILKECSVVVDDDAGVAHSGAERGAGYDYMIEGCTRRCSAYSIQRILFEQAFGKEASQPRSKIQKNHGRGFSHIIVLLNSPSCDPFA